jgi:hypothetical protein
MSVGFPGSHELAISMRLGNYTQDLQRMKGGQPGGTCVPPFVQICRKGCMAVYRITAHLAA